MTMLRCISGAVDSIVPVEHEWKGSIKSHISLWVRDERIFTWYADGGFIQFSDTRYRTAEWWLQLHLWLYERGYL